MAGRFLHPVTREETEYVVLNHVTRCGQPCKKKKKDRVAWPVEVFRGMEK